MATELELVHLILILGFSLQGPDGAGHAEQAVALVPQLPRQTHGFALVEVAALHANGALRAASVSAGERKWVTLLFEAVEDVLPFRDVVGDGATLLAPVNRDPVAGTHEGLLAVPCYILTCPI